MYKKIKLQDDFVEKNIKKIIYCKIKTDKELLEVFNYFLSKMDFSADGAFAAADINCDEIRIIDYAGDYKITLERAIAELEKIRYYKTLLLKSGFYKCMPDEDGMIYLYTNDSKERIPASTHFYFKDFCYYPKKEQLEFEF